MKVLVSGGTGLVGRYIVNGLLEAGHAVVVGARTPPPSHCFAREAEYVPMTLDPDMDQAGIFAGIDAFIHAAFDHLPGKYRGAEGKDPERFRRLNLDGTVSLFEGAKAAGVQRVVFLSSRAVYDGLPCDVELSETAALSPTSVYGQVKWQAERTLRDMAKTDFVTASLRLTGVYGDLQPNKWDSLFADYRAGRPIASRAGTEVHGRDVASAVQLMLEADAGDVNGQVFNVSDIVVDHAEVLAPLRDALRASTPLPQPADPTALRRMRTDKIAALGWRPGGKQLLNDTLDTLVAAHAVT